MKQENILNIQRLVWAILFHVIQVALGTGYASALSTPAVTVRSPGSQSEMRLFVNRSKPCVQFAILYQGETLIDPSTLDTLLAQGGSLAEGATIEDVSQQIVDKTSELYWGKTSRIHDFCRTATVRLISASGIRWTLELRAYDDAVAFRYGFPEQEALSSLSVKEELSEFHLAGDPLVLHLPLENFTTSHESLYRRKRLSALLEDQLLDVPLLCEWPDGTAVAITEARLRDYAGMYLERSPGSKGLRIRLSPLPETTEVCVAARTPHQSPWRVILLGERAGDLIASNVLLCLNEPAEGDYSWVVPGKTTFPWWNGTIENGPPSSPEANFEINKRYIDFCAANGIEYHGISSVAGNHPWYVQREPGFSAPRGDSDILTPGPDIDLPRILAYAREKRVGIRLWVNWQPLREHLKEAFTLYEQWGIRGLMVDFMDRDDQQMVQFQERVLRSAAKHHLHIQFHGAYKPTGEQRTFPNMFNREGVLNLEYLKWSDKCSPPHNVIVAYTRLLAGPTDYHAGGFRSAARAHFAPREKMPVVLGSRCHHLAIYVVYENPMPMVCDDPSAYENQPGFGFLREVPTTWDETRFVDGVVGKYVVVARRSGDRWYLGGMNDWTTRRVSLPLEFLADGDYSARLYLDESLDGSRPNKVRQEVRNVSAGKTLDIDLASGGGVVAILQPEK